MNKNHIIELVIKGFGAYLGVIALSHVVRIIAVLLESYNFISASTDLLMEIVYLIIYLFASLFVIIRSKKIGTLIFGHDEETSELDKIKVSNDVDKSFLAKLVFKILGVINFVMALGTLINLLYRLIANRNLYSLSNHNILMGLISNLIPPLITLLVAVILMKTPNWLMRFFRL